MREFKVVILGPGGVGKSALTVQFISGKFVERYDPTVEDFYRKEIEVGGDPAILEILDTAGTEQFASMRDLYIKNGQGFIIVYSLTSRQSFQDIKHIREQITRVKGTDRVPIVLAANKCDLHEQQREVSTEEGCDLATDWSVPYLETSAKNSSVVNSLFIEIVNEMNVKSTNYNSTRKERKKEKKKQQKQQKLQLQQQKSASMSKSSKAQLSSSSHSSSNTYSSSSNNPIHHHSKEAKLFKETKNSSSSPKNKSCANRLSYIFCCCCSCCCRTKTAKNSTKHHNDDRHYNTNSSCSIL